jgi:hypothetical protein
MARKSPSKHAAPNASVSAHVEHAELRKSYRAGLRLKLAARPSYSGSRERRLRSRMRFSNSPERPRRSIIRSSLGSLCRATLADLADLDPRIGSSSLI